MIRKSVVPLTLCRGTTFRYDKFEMIKMYARQTEKFPGIKT